MKLKDFAYGVVIIVLVILLMQRQCAHRSERQLYQSLNDSLITRIDDDGLKIKQMRVLDGDRKLTIKALRSTTDSLSHELAELIRKGGRNTTGATIIETTTTVYIRDTTRVTRYDTAFVINNDTFYLDPIYEHLYEDEWIKSQVKATKDSIILTQYFKNKIEITERKKWNRTVLDIKNLNPYTDTEAVKSWTVKRKPRRWGVGIHAGYGVGSDLQLRPHIGVGVQWSVISF